MFRDLLTNLQTAYLAGIHQICVFCMAVDLLMTIVCACSETESMAACRLNSILQKLTNRCISLFVCVVSNYLSCTLKSMPHHPVHRCLNMVAGRQAPELVMITTKKRSANQGANHFYDSLTSACVQGVILALSMLYKKKYNST